MLDGINRILTIPEGADVVRRADEADRLTAIEAAVGHHIAIQSNASTTAYQTAAPFRALFNGMKFGFVPLYDNTGAATLAVNGLTAVWLCDPAGTQITAAGALLAHRIYWLEYDSALNGGAGGFRVYLHYVDLVSAQTITGNKTFDGRIYAMNSVMPMNGNLFAITPDGGFAVWLDNRTGAASVKGLALNISTAYDRSVSLALAQTDITGLIYSDGVADGQGMWVVIAGLAYALLAATTAVATSGLYMMPSLDNSGTVTPFTYTGDSIPKGPIALASQGSVGGQVLVPVLMHTILN